MREILFRGQDAVTREWIYGCYVDNRDRGRCPPIIVPKNGNPHIYVIPETVGQFTGRLDKNSREIYEGDIVRIEDSSNAIIEYSKLEAMFIFNFIGKWKIYGTWDTARKNIEIIGNIHDNAELLT